MSPQKPLVGFAGLSSLVSQIPDRPQVKDPLGPTEGASTRPGIEVDLSQFGIGANAQPGSPKTETEKNTSTTPNTGTTAPSSPAFKPSGLKTGTVVGILAAVGLFLIWAVSQNSPQTPSSFPTYAPAPTINRNPPSQPALPIPPVIPPATYIQVAPVPGDGDRRLSQENIRWCLYQDRRIEIIRSIISNSRSDEDVTSFNAIIEDFNSRCSRYRYRETDMASVRAELASKESNLQSEAVRIVSAWPHRRIALLPQPPRSQPGPSVGSNLLPSSDVVVPQVQPVPVQTDNVVAEVQALDLLQMPDATKVQRRLVELGFLGVPPNGIWGPRSRQALREFKFLNGLPRDDAWDQQTYKQLFSLSAQKKSGAGQGIKTSNSTQENDTNYPPPPGTTLNPLNRGDAISLQQRLAEFGFFAGKSDGLWGQASRDALRKFKVANGLAADDQWNSETETALKNGQPGQANETFIGGWAGTIAECQDGQIGQAPLQITERRAEIGNVVCDFQPPQREGLGWRTQANCTEPGKQAWRANVKILVSGGRLTWSSESGTVSFVRCQGG